MRMRIGVVGLLHSLLAGVTLEDLPYEKFIKLYDKPSTLFYLDPPYYHSESCYGASLFSREDFMHIRDMLSEIKGRFILSLNDVPEIRKLYKDFNIEIVETRYTINVKGKSPKRNELLISN